MRRALALLILIVVAAGCGGSAPGGGGGGGGGGEFPPLSVAWFGTAFDPSSFALQGRATGLKQGTPIVAVGTLFSSRPPEDMSVTISIGGSVRKTVPVAAGAPSPSSTYAADLTPAALGPGTYIVSFVDKKGTILASGNLNVTP